NKVYFQQYTPGDSCAAIFVSGGLMTQFLGVTRQLIGKTWLHAEPFHYCGSVGPLTLDRKATDAFCRLGDALVRGFGLRGLFGIDCILRGGLPYPVEVNPRSTASVEVLEHATGVAALALHASAFNYNTTGVLDVSTGWMRHWAAQKDALRHGIVG